MNTQRNIPDWQSLTPLNQGQIVSDTAWNGLARNIQHVHGVGVYGGGMSVANGGFDLNFNKSVPVSILTGYNYICLSVRFRVGLASLAFPPGQPTYSEVITITLNRSGSTQELAKYVASGFQSVPGAEVVPFTNVSYDRYIIAELTESVRASIGNRERAYITIKREIPYYTLPLNSGVQSLILTNYKEC